MFERNIQYRCLMFLGAGNKLAYYELSVMLNKGKDKVKEEVFQSYLKRLLEYNILTLDERTHQPFRKFLPCSKFMITEKGNKALDCYKYMRYHNDGKNYYRLEEGAENIEYKIIPNKRADGIYWDANKQRYRADLTKI